MEGKNINVSINDGDAFFAHEMSVNFNPMQFTLDFRNITPRNDLRNREQPSLLVKHNVVMVDPWHMKLIHDLMGRMLKKYEDEYGRISKPKAIEAFEKKHKTKKEDRKGAKTEVPSYFG